MRQLLKDVSGGNGAINDSAIIGGAPAHLSSLKGIRLCEENGVRVMGEELCAPGDEL